VESGADGIEVDVQLTRDGQLVVLHDFRLGRTIKGNGQVSRYTLSELRSMDAGSWFSSVFEGVPPPTLDEVFEVLPRDFLVNVEMRVIFSGMKRIARRVAEAVRQHGRLDSTLVASYNPVALYYLRRFEPQVARGYIWSKHHPYPARLLSSLAHPHWYAPVPGTYDVQLLRQFHRQGKRVLAWDVDFEGDLTQMAEVRLDAVVTDWLPALVQRKMELP